MTHTIDKFSSLPPANTTRWVIRRKAQVVSGVRKGLITVQEAMERYGISLEEYESWEHAIDAFGINGLKATKVQKYKDGDSIRRTKKLVRDAMEEHHARPLYPI